MHRHKRTPELHYNCYEDTMGQTLPVLARMLANITVFKLLFLIMSHGK